ncbi:hypothetical protein DM01DRAFT_328624 [Hesseltinella vesiculosa]|uniref:Yeast cell wall synthesis Kre9/Knh1-like N-terminal domain-containing protein n=1 Tax=Hesseltinella vesiculosa TaxID=101127 RepID=A0A1X2GPD8_9FUNG|nr:hypothetical protein DM01DRAFT_328624 [Hesseltinella vesiculosa]
MIRLSLSLLFCASMITLSAANMAPSTPEPGTVWVEDKEYDIDDKGLPSISESWQDFRIELMTGEDENQVKLGTIASNVNPLDKKITIRAPKVSPHAPIYFLMFSNDHGEFAWTTRFAIVDAGLKQLAPEKSSQPNGQKIPWGIGKLAAPLNEEGVFKAAAVNAANTTVSSSAMVQPSSASSSQSASISSVASSVSSASYVASSPSSASAQPSASGKKKAAARSDATSTSVSMAIFACAFMASLVVLA